MKLPWLRGNFLARRRLDRIFLDVPDFIARAGTGRRHWPPYSLRAFVGGAQGFDQVGRWFVEDCRKLFSRGAQILDIGCGCGRLAYALATDPALCELDISYVGMDVDRACVRWCRKHITPMNPRFNFYHADCYNASYNPRGKAAAASYRLPHPDGSFQVILLTSVLTHVLEEELRHYLAEVARLLAPDGVAYASLFLYRSGSEAATGLERHSPLAFPFVQEHCAVNRLDCPANAVAYREDFVMDVVNEAGLRLTEPIRYGIQDVLLLESPPSRAGAIHGVTAPSG